LRNGRVQRLDVHARERDRHSRGRRGRRAWPSPSRRPRAGRAPAGPCILRQ
jgi:hypothetical protein